MARNIPLSRSDYIFFRQWLRSTSIIWRDVTDSAIIPIWAEAVCRQDVLDENGKTPGERAFLCLKQIYPNLNLRWRQSEFDLLHFRPPKLYTGPFSGDVFCLDLSSAYSQIYSRLFLHCDFPKRRLRYPLHEIARVLQTDKLGRNAVVGIARSTKNKWRQGEKVWYVTKQNRYLSPPLWAHLMLILNEIAQNMIEFGAVHINTDGYAFTTLAGLRLAKRFMDNHGLVYKSYSGIGSIIGISGLSIPGIKDPVELNPSKPTFHLEKTDGTWVEWWKKLS